MRPVRDYCATAFLLLALPLSVSAQTEGPVATGDTLQTVLASVYRSNPQLLAERARLREIDENYVQARAQGRPTLSAGGQVSLQATRSPDAGENPFIPSGGEDWVDTEPRSATLNLVQPIYQGGRVKALKRQTGASILAARAGLEQAENSIFLSAANAYVNLLRDSETARIRRNNVLVLTRQLSAANARFEVGEGTRTDIAQSESRLAAAEAGLALADAQTEITRATFVRLVGRLPDRPSPLPTFVIPESLDEAIALAADNNPQLLGAYYNELAGEAAIDVAKANGRPVVSLSGSVVRSRGTLLGFQDQDQATIGANLTLPIYSGGANRSRVRQAKQARTRLKFEARDTERAVAERITQIWVQMDAAQRIVETSRRQLSSAQVAFEGVTLEQDVGTRTQLDVLDAEQETLNASLTLLNAERDYEAAVLQLLSAIGVLDADGIDLPVEPYRPDSNFAEIVKDDFAQGLDKASFGLAGKDARITRVDQIIDNDMNPERPVADPK